MQPTVWNKASSLSAVSDYDAAADGKKFLVVTGPPEPPITVVLNWPAAFAR